MRGGVECDIPLVRCLVLFWVELLVWREHGGLYDRWMDWGMRRWMVIYLHVSVLIGRVAVVRNMI